MSASPSLPPSSSPPPTSNPSVHLLTLRNPSSVSDPRAWGLSGAERGHHMARVVSDRLTSGDGNEFGERHPVKMANRLRSVSSVEDWRAWSLEPAERRRFMVDMIRRSPVASTSDLQHQELMTQLRENNLPEFVERLLSDKNQQIDELQRNMRSLTQQSMRSVSAGDRSSGPALAVSSLSDDHHPSPEVLRRAATSVHSDPEGDLTRPDISMVQQKQEPTPPSAGRPSSPSRPLSPPPGSEHSWDSAGTVPRAGGSRLGSSAGSEPASAAGSSASGDSIHNLRAALARKKQLLNARKEELERDGRGEREEGRQSGEGERVRSCGVERSERQMKESQQAVESPDQPIATDDAEVAHTHHQLLQFRSRLDVLTPILSRLEADYATLSADPVPERTQTASETGRLRDGVEEMRGRVERGEEERARLERELEAMDREGVAEWDHGRRQLQQRLVRVLRDLELDQLEACSRIHQASALVTADQRRQQQSEESERLGADSEPASSGYLSEMPDTAASPAQRANGVSRSAEASPPPDQKRSPPRDVKPSPAREPAADTWLSPRSGEVPAEPDQPRYQPDFQQESSDTEGESAFESGVTELGSDTEQAGSECGPGVDWQSSCPSLTDEMAGLVDINSELDRLRSRITELELELGQRGDAPSPSPGPWRSRLEQERAAWSQERQQLQQRISLLTTEQERLRRLGAGRAGDTADDARLEYAYGRFLRAESYRRALCWQKRYLLILLGGYQETEVMTLKRMTQLTGGRFRPDGRSYVTPLGKFRAAALVAVAVARMGFMVNRWRSGRRLAGALSGPPDLPGCPLVRPPSSSSLVSAASCNAYAELDRLGRIVRDCPTSTPDVQWDNRSQLSVSDVCTEDLEPYLARFDALLDRQGLPPQPGKPDSSR